MSVISNFIAISLFFNEPVDPGVPKRPIRFKLILCYGFLRTFLRMSPQVIPQLWNVNKRKKSMGHETTVIHCGLHALEVTNLNVLASNLLRTCVKSPSLPNSMIFITERHLHMFLTLDAVSSNSRKCEEDLFEPDSRFQRWKVPDRLWIIKITYLSVETNKLQKVLPTAYPSTYLNQCSIQQHLHIPAAVNTLGNLIKFS